jgi:hypothetical protein
MTEDRLALTELLEKAGEGDFLRASSLQAQSSVLWTHSITQPSIGKLCSGASGSADFTITDPVQFVQQFGVSGFG